MTKQEIVVADAGPLIALAKCEMLSLLALVFSEIHVPQSVLKEAIGGRAKPETEKIRVFVQEHCKVQPDKESEFISTLLERLDPGESQAIGLGAPFAVRSANGREKRASNRKRLWATVDRCFGVAACL
jgi:predicted nucleic acid-binding protein